MQSECHVKSILKDTLVIKIKIIKTCSFKKIQIIKFYHYLSLLRLLFVNFNFFFYKYTCIVHIYSINRRKDRQCMFSDLGIVQEIIFV